MSGMGTHEKKTIPKADVQPIASKLNLREDFDLENSIFNVLDIKQVLYFVSSQTERDIRKLPVCNTSTAQRGS